MNRADYYPSPCLKCTRVADPAACENKACVPWRQWFIHRWEGLRRQARQGMDGRQGKHLGVSVGGRVYPHPIQVQDYLCTDPCEKCICPKDVCFEPCCQKRAWLEAKKEVFV